MRTPRTYTGDDFRDALRGAAVIANHSASIIRELTEALRKIERESAHTLADERGNSIKLHISLKYCRDVARDTLKSAQVRNGQP